MSTADLSVLISCLSNLRNVARAVRLETPLEVLGCDRGSASSGAREPNFKRGVSGQFFTPDDSTQSDVSCYSSRSDDGVILPECDSDGINCVWCQEHEEVDSVSTLCTEFCEGFSDVGNWESCSVPGHIVRNDLLVVEGSNWSVCWSDWCCQRLDGVLSSRKPSCGAANFIGKSR